MSITANPIADATRFHDAAAKRDLATDARDRAAADEEALTWSRIQRGENSSAGVSVAASLVNDVGDVLAQDDGLVERLIVNAAGMRKQDALRGWYAEAIARDVEALVAKAIAGYAFAAALEASA